jgi:hypothetical protein
MDVRMILKKAANVVVAITDATLLDRVREEKEPSAFNATNAQDYLTAPDQ